MIDDRAPRIDFGSQIPRRAPIDALAAPDTDTALREALDLAQSYRLVAQELLRGLEHAIRQRDALRARLRAR